MNSTKTYTFSIVVKEKKKAEKLDIAINTCHPREGLKKNLNLFFQKGVGVDLKVYI